MSEFVVEDGSEDFVVASWRQVVFYSFYGQVTGDVLRRIDRVHDHVAKRYPAQTVAFCICHDTIPLPDANGRKVAGELTRKRPQEQVISAIVLQGGGLWVATARSIAMGISLANAQGRRNRVFTTIEEAANWTVEVAAQPIDAAALKKYGALVAAMRPGQKPTAA